MIDWRKPSAMVHSWFGGQRSALVTPGAGLVFISRQASLVKTN
jgi:hypothetical protein